jgi:hypothetical protein
MVWKDCGYLCISKSGKKIVIVINHVRYVATLEAFKKVLEGRQHYTLVYEPPEKRQEPLVRHCMDCGVELHPKTKEELNDELCDDCYTKRLREA